MMRRTAMPLLVLTTLGCLAAGVTFAQEGPPRRARKFEVLSMPREAGRFITIDLDKLPSELSDELLHYAKQGDENERERDGEDEEFAPKKGKKGKADEGKEKDYEEDKKARE